MHLKNFSLIETQEGSQIFHLSPAYDLLPVNSIIPEDTEEMALTLNEKKNNIKRDDFVLSAVMMGISEKVTERLIEKVISLKKIYTNLCDNSILTNNLKESIKNIITQRTEKLSI